MAKRREKPNDLENLINSVSTEVSGWPNWLQQNAESILVSTSSNIKTGKYTSRSNDSNNKVLRQKELDQI